MKRFIYKDRLIKMKEDIEFPEVLKISDSILAPSLRLGAFGDNSQGKRREYRLFSVVNHKGTEATKGHYVCYTLDSRNEWVFYDDHKMKSV